ncbi:ribonuclease HI [bacterium]|nr:ribonuclease HI [bacterium]
MDEWVLYRLDGEALDRLAAGEDPPAPSPAEEVPKDKPKFDPKEPIVIHTDGGSQPNPGVGGWAAVLRWGDQVRRISGGELGTTNNRMELTAAIRALESLKRKCFVELHTDSTYLRQGITKWIKGWKKNDWMRGKGRDRSPVKNADLWKRLDAVCEKQDVEWHWLRGHSGHSDNELCDHLCQEEIRRQIANSTRAERDEALQVEYRRREEEEARG